MAIKSQLGYNMHKPLFSSLLFCFCVLSFNITATRKEVRLKVRETNRSDGIVNINDLKNAIEMNGSYSACGTSEPLNLAEYSRGEVSMMRLRSSDTTTTSSEIKFRKSGTVVIPVYFHVIQSSSGEGFLSDEQLDAQIDVLNKAFSGKDTYHCDGNAQTGITVNTAFRFLKTGVNRATNDTWYKNSNGGDMNMKRKLRVGGCETMNIYTINPPVALYGWATFPQDCSTHTARDGVTINYSTFPDVDNSRRSLNFGDTTVHEAGHWLGLFHPFRNGCDGGDEVDDTPAQGEGSFGCPIGKNTCTNMPGIDSIFNFMDYTHDCCMYTFTSGQSERMDLLHQQYRESEMKYTLSPTFTPTEKKCSKKHNVTVKIMTDSFPQETTWYIKAADGVIKKSGGKKAGVFEDCFEEDCYTFTIEDTGKDGMCCNFGQGFYEVYWKNETIGKGGNFKEKEEVTFGCPELASCQERCKRIEQKRTLSIACRRSYCRACEECKTIQYPCPDKCYDKKSRLSKRPWAKKCRIHCAGCPLCLP